MTKDEIFAALEEVHLRFYESALNGDNELLSLSVSQWSPAQHVQHINKSIGAIARFLIADQSVLADKFGKSGRSSKSFEDVEQVFGKYFEKKPQSTSDFVPAAPESISLSLEVVQGRQILSAMQSALQNWTEEKLDEQNCPHPLAGMFTTREMLFFSIIHAQHHHKAVEKIQELPAAAQAK